MGTEGNERADHLAKTAAMQNKYNEQINLPIPTSIIRDFFNKKSISDWQIEWSTSTKGRQTYQILKQVDPTFICHGTVIPNYLSGHGSFPEFLKKIGKQENDLCLCRKGRETVIHYLIQKCPIIPYHFHFDKHKTLRQNLQKILFSSTNFHKLKENYQTLNKHYSFILSTDNRN